VNSFNVWTGSSEERDIVLFPKTPANFIYHISKTGSPAEVAESLGQGHPLTFVVAHRSIDKGEYLSIELM
jgi:hypothetical protein